MMLLLDSASLEDALRGQELGLACGVTTNPTLMRRETDDPLRHLAALLAAFERGDVYYQPSGVDGDQLGEAMRAHDLAPDRVVLKLPATVSGAGLAAALVRRRARVALTAVQSVAAVAVAETIGCEAVIPYVDRAARDVRIEAPLVPALVRLRRGVRIVAASIKGPGQVVAALRDGADAVSAPLPVLTALLSHPAAEEAEREFAQAYAVTRR